MRRQAIMATAALAFVLALPQAAGADDVQGASDFVDATVATENANLVHYQQVAGQADDDSNISCRTDKPVFVSQPEYDGRITVKGEDDAATTVECVDIMLVAEDRISGVLYIEWLEEGGYAQNPLDWNRVSPADTPCESRMAHGVGACTAVLSYVFPANDPSQGRPHRACIDLALPHDFAPLCQTFLSKSKTTV